MKRFLTGNCIVQCEQCDENHNIIPEEPGFFQVASEIKSLGEELTFMWEQTIHCDCGNCIEIEYLVNEYPLNVLNWEKVTIECGIEIQRFIINFSNMP